MSFKVTSSLPRFSDTFSLPSTQTVIESLSTQKDRLLSLFTWIYPQTLSQSSNEELTTDSFLKIDTNPRRPLAPIQFQTREKQQEPPPSLRDFFILAIHDPEMGAKSWPKIKKWVLESQKLDFSGCDLVSIPDNFFQFREIIELNLSRNSHFNYISEFPKFACLQKLSLIMNDLEEIPPLVFTLQTLRVLDLDHNRISKVPKDIANLVPLEEFSCQHNRVVEVAEEIYSLKNLTILELMGNPLKELSVKEFNHTLNVFSINGIRVRKIYPLEEIDL